MSGKLSARNRLHAYLIGNLTESPLDAHEIDADQMRSGVPATPSDNFCRLLIRSSEIVGGSSEIGDDKRGGDLSMRAVELADDEE